MSVVEEDGFNGELLLSYEQFDVVIEDDTLGINTQRIPAAATINRDFQRLRGGNDKRTHTQ